MTEILGEAAGQLETSSSLCHDYWTPTPLSHAELEAFLDDVEPEELGVSITAKAGMRPADYVELIERAVGRRDAVSRRLTDSAQTSVFTSHANVPILK